jgi:hypothetical protein
MNSEAFRKLIDDFNSDYDSTNEQNKAVEALIRKHFDKAIGSCQKEAALIMGVEEVEIVVEIDKVRLYVRK